MRFFLYNLLFCILGSPISTKMAFGDKVLPSCARWSVRDAMMALVLTSLALMGMEVLLGIDGSKGGADVSRGAMVPATGK